MIEMPKLSEANKIVMRYFVRSAGKDSDPSTIESMLLLVQMDGYAAGYGEGYDDAETHRAEDEAGGCLMMNENLRMRLSHMSTPEEERFFDALCIDLVKMADQSVSVIYDNHIGASEDDSAYTEYYEDTNHYRVHIDSRLDFGSRCDFLIHEMAHVMSWRHKEKHGEFWGTCYAKLYREYLKTYTTFWNIR